MELKTESVDGGIGPSRQRLSANNDEICTNFHRRVGGRISSSRRRAAHLLRCISGPSPSVSVVTGEQMTNFSQMTRPSIQRLMSDILSRGCNKLTTKNIIRRPYAPIQLFVDGIRNTGGPCLDEEVAV